MVGAQTLTQGGPPRPTPYGSVVDNPRLPRRDELPWRVCVDRTYLYGSPGPLFAGTVHRNQPVSIQRRSVSGEWTRVVPDVGNRRLDQAV